MEKDRFIIVNKIVTPDGTELVSRHVHDYVTHTDKNGYEYMTDGGTSYMKRFLTPKSNGAYYRLLRLLNIDHTDPNMYKDTSVYSTDDFEFSYVRNYIYRGGRGKDGKQPIKYIKLSELSDNWLVSLIEYEEERRPNNRWLPFYRLEKLYRKSNNIVIEE